MESKRIIGTVLGVIGVYLWFTPLAYVDSMGPGVYLAGHHIGGIAYLLLFSLFAYSVLSWITQHIPRIIAASVSLTISLLFLFQVGSSAALGLFGLIIVSAVGIYLAVRDKKTTKPVR